jgi:PhnB protein
MSDITQLFARLVVSDAAGAIDFYTRAFGAVQKGERHVIDGKVVHAEVVIGPASVHLKDEGDGDPAPTTLGGTPVILGIDVADADAVAARMIEAGATVIYPITDTEYGMRGGRLADPYGHQWMIHQPL